MSAAERLAVAALASLALHALVIAGAWVPMPQLPGEVRPLEARLAPAPPRAEPARVAAPWPDFAQRRTAPAPAVTPAPATPRALAATGPFILPELPAETPVQAAEPAAAELPAQVALAAETSAAAIAVRTLPRRGRIVYNVVYGENRFNVGKVVQSWEVKADAYTLASEAETSGVVDLFRPQRLRYMSQGRILPQGLRPDTFLVSRTRRGQNEASRVSFDWTAGHLTYGHAREPQQAALPAGAQDLMSFIYQFSLAPPVPGRYRLPIATGSRFEVYEIEVAGEESIETPIGALKALPVKQIARAGSESIEFWLATEYRYLPVRIRHYDREGRFSGEQLVSEIRLSED